MIESVKERLGGVKAMAEEAVAYAASMRLVEEFESEFDLVDPDEKWRVTGEAADTLEAFVDWTSRDLEESHRLAELREKLAAAIDSAFDEMSGIVMDWASAVRINYYETLPYYEARDNFAWGIANTVGSTYDEIDDLLYECENATRTYDNEYEPDFGRVAETMHDRFGLDAASLVEIALQAGVVVSRDLSEEEIAEMFR